MFPKMLKPAITQFLNTHLKAPRNFARNHNKNKTTYHPPTYKTVHLSQWGEVPEVSISRDLGQLSACTP